MSNELFNFSIPVFIRHLRILDDILAIGERHVRDRGIDPASLALARLHADMFSLAGQVRAACSTAERSAARLLGAEPADSKGDGATFPELHGRIDEALRSLAKVAERDFDGAEERTVRLPAGTDRVTLTAREYLMRFSLPNFYFHVTTAYDILRHNGVALGKRDFLRLTLAT